VFTMLPTSPHDPPPFDSKQVIWAVWQAIAKHELPGLPSGRAALARCVMLAVLRVSHLRQLAGSQPHAMQLAACYCLDAEQELEAVLEMPAHREAFDEYETYWQDLMFFYQRVPELQELVEYAQVGLLPVEEACVVQGLCCGGLLSWEAH
jgi:hypothetical protein